RREYRLEVGGASYRSETGDDGSIEHVLPPGAEEGRLVLLAGAETPDRPEECAFALKLGSLDPVDQASGVQARLNNLGLFASREADGHVVGEAAEQLARAIRRFQVLHQIEPTGDLDERTRRALDQAHREGGRMMAEGGTKVEA